MNTCKTIAVYNFKGGVGKTSTALNLAYSWSRFFKVLVVDCDAQSNLTYSLTKTKTLDMNLYTIAKSHLHMSPMDIEPVIISPYLHLIPGSYYMAELESNSQFITFGEEIIQKIFTSIKKNYDLILVDCPTHFGITVRSTIANSNSILIPAMPDSFSISGFVKLLAYLEKVKKNKPLNVLGILFNQYRKTTLFHRKVVKEARETLGDLIFNQTIRASIKVSEAHQLNQSIYQFPKENTVIQDYLALSDEIIERLNVLYLGDLIKKVG